MAAQTINRITVRGQGSRSSTGIMASATGTIPVSGYAFNVGRSHSIFAAPLALNTRLQSGRVSLTAEPNSAPEHRHVGTQTGILGITSAPQYPLPSPMQLGRAATGGTAQSSFGIPTVRGSLARPGQVFIPTVQRKQLRALQLVKGRASGG